MIALFFRTLVKLIFTLFVSAAAIFYILNILPGDPAAIMLGINATPQAVADLHQSMGLDQPLPQQFAQWVFGVLQFDLGTGHTYNVPVSTLIGERIGVTLPLALLSFCISLAFGLTLGALAALRAGTWADRLCRGLALVFLSVPNFWAGLLLILVFSVQLHFFPSGGFPGWDQGVWRGFQSLCLPACALSLAQSAILLRITRASLRDVLSEPYIRTARAKGLGRGAALYRHAFQNAILPVLTLLGLHLTFLLTGVIVIENVFALPGVGRLLFQAVSQHDLPVVQNVLLLFVIAILLVNFLIEIIATSIDPRLRETYAA